MSAVHCGLVWQFSCGLQSLDCKMSLEIQQLDTGMAVLQGIACCSWEDRGGIFGKHLVHSEYQFLVLFLRYCRQCFTDIADLVHVRHVKCVFF